MAGLLKRVTGDIWVGKFKRWSKPKHFIVWASTKSSSRLPILTMLTLFIMLTKLTMLTRIASLAQCFLHLCERGGRMRRARGLRPHWRESWVERREASGASVTSVKTSPTFPFPYQLFLILFLGSVLLGDLCKSSNISIKKGFHF